jgi:hypothetical protein
VLVVHGLIHLIGFLVPWELAVVEGFPYRTTVLGGALELGDAGARVLGLAWLAVAAGFVVAGGGWWRRAAWAMPLTLGLALGSTALCLLAWPEAATGIPVNAAILAVVAWTAAGWPRHLGAVR